MRIVIEEPCEHGALAKHGWQDNPIDGVQMCPGGSRRILPEGSLVISKENGEWPNAERLRLAAQAWREGLAGPSDHAVIDEALSFAWNALAEGVVVGADRD